MFVGKHDVKVDGQGRASFPLVFRQAMGKQNQDTLFVFPGMLDTELSMTGCTAEVFDLLVDGSYRWDVNSREMARLLEFTTGEATMQEIDGKHRITLDRERFGKMGVGDTVRFVGYGHFFHVWEPSRHDGFRRSLREEGPLPTVNIHAELSRMLREARAK